MFIVCTQRKAEHESSDQSTRRKCNKWTFVNIFPRVLFLLLSFFFFFFFGLLPGPKKLGQGVMRGTEFRSTGGKNTRQIKKEWILFRF